MCGIVGYVGGREACPILLKGLHRLEYRGYDSAGVAMVDEDGIEIDGAVCIVTDAAKIYIPMGDLVDFEAERARLNKELASAQKQLDGINAKLSNENFVSKAPAPVVEAQREAARKLNEKIAMLNDSLSKIANA